MNTRQPEARPFDAGVALLISIIAFTVAMLLPSKGRAQEILPAPMPLGNYQTLPALTLKNESDPIRKNRWIDRDTVFSCCDQTPRTADSIECLGLVFIDTCCASIWQRWPNGRFSSPNTKKDTVTVIVLCSNQISIASYNPPGGAVAHVSIQDYTEIVEKKQERTLEWQTVSLPVPSRNGMTPAIYATETKWVTTATRWLEDTSGCYQLVPLE